MGWSCTAKAHDTLDRISNACVANGGSQNQWTCANGTYFFETSRVEHPGGAVTGTVWKTLQDGVYFRRSGSFRIEADGTVSRGPAWMKEAAALVRA